MKFFEIYFVFIITSSKLKKIVYALREISLYFSEFQVIVNIIFLPRKKNTKLYSKILFFGCK